MPAVASMVRAWSSAATRRSLTGGLSPASPRDEGLALVGGLFTAPFMVCAKTATRMATPSRKPSWRAVFSMPEPAPLTPPGTALMPAASSAGSERPMPAPTSALRQSTEPTRVGAREVPERHETGGRDERAGHRREPGSDPVRQPAGDRREHQHGGRQDSDGEAGLELRVVHHRDHEDDEHERGAHQRRVHGHDRRARRGEGAPPEEAQVEEGRGGAQLPPRPEGEERHRGGEQTEDDGRRPAPIVALDDRQGEAEEARGDQADAGPVQRFGGAGLTAATHQRERQHDAQRADRDVEPEDRRPAPALDEQPPGRVRPRRRPSSALRTGRRRIPAGPPGTPAAAGPAPWARRPRRRPPVPRAKR